ncbi:MAG TPA: YheC/YheD family protein [Bacilli bacterium]|nr:YheC/YheD family protein [Bacilli bacterium]
MQDMRLGLMTTDLPKVGTDESISALTWQVLAEEGAASGMLVSLFAPSGVDVRHRTFEGFAWDEEKGWVETSGPLPAVVVDNVFLRIARHDKRYARQKKELQQAGITFLNPRFVDKWAATQALEQAEALRPHLPKTVLLERPEEVEAWLSHTTNLFLKPVRGSGGLGVLCVSRADHDQFFLAGAGRTRKVSRADLRYRVRDALRRSRHLLQKGVSLVEVDGHKVDLRVVVYRDEQGLWQPIATVPRLGRKGRAVTNLARGGKVRTYAWLASRMRRQGVRVPVQAEVERVALRAAEAVTKLRPTLSYLGIDIGLDASGGLWVLDINPRPGRKVLSLEDRRLAYRCLVGFAKRLMKEDSRL